ncbi:putative MFS family arabinose efflux permease [Streptomyces sp. 1114.5]|uniref:MFS transporter n=1 Tax=Streptomyces sp. 1114.5 TaxID=1938830 RepID=UPI000EB1011E|nr:MFS transporter [Streptomyces sp. 1114.5]RKT09289.1 putative MFS family arabinose efflux permease [Streptomyces sp. 1114.5]
MSTGTRNTAAGAGARSAPASRGAGGTLRAGLLLAALAAPGAAGLSAPSLVLPAIARDLHTGPGPAAWLMSGYGLGMMLGTPLLTGTAGRRGPRALLLASAGALLIGVLVTLAAGTALGPLVAGRAVLAVGAAGFNVAAFQLAARQPDARASGLVAIGSAAGGTAGLFIGAAVAAGLGWRACLMLPVPALAALPAALRGCAAAQTAQGTGDRPAARRSFLGLDSLAVPRFRTVAAVMLVLATVNFSLVYGAPRRAAALTGWSAVQTGAVASLATLSGALLSWLLVRAASRLGLQRTAGLLLGVSCTALALAAFAPWAPLVLLGAGASACVNAAGQGVLTGAAARAVAPQRQPEAIGLFNLVFLLGAALGPQLAAFGGRIAGLGP